MTAGAGGGGDGSRRPATSRPVGHHLRAPATPRRGRAVRESPARRTAVPTRTRAGDMVMSLPPDPHDDDLADPSPAPPPSPPAAAAAGSPATAADPATLTGPPAGAAP